MGWIQKLEPEYAKWSILRLLKRLGLFNQFADLAMAIGILYQHTTRHFSKEA